MSHAMTTKLSNCMLQGQTIHTIAKETIEDCAQLCKANSITGNKMNNVDVIYTMWSNLKKTPGMEPGQVSFFKDKEVGVVTLSRVLMLHLGQG